MVEREKKRFNKIGQITIFVIIAIVLVAAIGGYFLVKNYYFPSVPANIAPVYDYYFSCIKQKVIDGASLMGSQAGYITLPDFEPGSQYAPFSSQLGFVGAGVPYWYYLSGNGVEKEQVPTKSQMQDDLGKYIDSKIGDCDFSSFRAAGYDIVLESASTKTTISTNKISAVVSQGLSINFGDSKFVASRHSTEANSNLGKFYDLALKIYNYEKQNSFLENYTKDVLYTYAPVSGSILNCSPMVWDPYTIFGKLKSALEANIRSIKITGDYYSLPSDDKGYFIVGKNELSVNNEQVNFMYSSLWPSRFEVWPTTNNLMIAEPVGNQKGMAVAGFCYVPYKFVYDMYFPVMIQILSSDGSEIFQFPIAVVINKNSPRIAVDSEFIERPETICDKANTDLTINTYDVNLNPINANIEFKCFSDVCSLGKTGEDNLSAGSLTTLVPQCMNALIIAKADGYSEKRYTISTNEETYADIVLDKEYKLPIEIYVDGKLSGENAVLSLSEYPLNSDVSEFVKAISYPFIKNMDISEGNYKFELKVYKDGNVQIPAVNTKQCTKVAKAGIIGLFGFEEEKCFDITIPAQTLSNFVYAGGYNNYYITPSELEKASVIRIFAKSAGTPATMEESQTIYDAVEQKRLDIQIV